MSPLILERFHTERPLQTYAPMCSRPAPVTVLMYHFLLDHPVPQHKPGADYVISAARFRREMEHLSDGGFVPLTMAGFAGCIEDGTPLPDCAVIITFDGGTAEWASVVAPLFASLDLKATLYVITGWVEDHPYDYVRPLGWGALKTLADQRTAAGDFTFEIGSHSVTHRPFVRAADESTEQFRRSVRFEMEASKKELEARLGRVVNTLALPHGLGADDGETERFVRECARELGYVAIRSSNRRPFNDQQIDPLRITTQYVATPYKPFSEFVYEMDKWRSPMRTNLRRWIRVRLRRMRSEQARAADA